MSDRAKVVAGQGLRNVPILLVLMGAVLARWPRLPGSLWYDETWYTLSGLRGEHLWRALLHDVHPPLYALVLAVWVRLFGDSEIAVRLPSLLFGLGSIAVTYIWADRWLGRRVALLAAALMAVSPAHIWHSTENKTNMLAVFLTVAAVALFDRAWGRGDRRPWLQFVVVASLALWTNVFVTFVVAALVLWMWWEVLRGNVATTWHRAVGVTLALGLALFPVLLSIWLQMPALERVYLRPFRAADAYGLLLLYFSHGNTIRTALPSSTGLRDIFGVAWSWYLVDAFFALVLVAGLVRVARRTGEGGREATSASMLVAWLIVPIVLVMLASLFVRDLYIERSLLILLPAYLIVVAAAVDLGPTAWRATALSGLVVCNVWALTALYSTKVDTWTVYKPRNDWRAAAAWLRSEQSRAPDDVVIFSTVPADALRFYLDRDVATARPLVIVQTRRRGLRLVRDELARHRVAKFYLVRDDFWDSGFKDFQYLVSSVADLSLVRTVRFKGVSIFEYAAGGSFG